MFIATFGRPLLPWGPQARQHPRARRSARKQVAQPLERRLTPDLADRVGQRNLLRARLDAVLRVAAVRDAARLHERRESLVRAHLAGRIHVEEERLPDRRGADEAAVTPHLRADLEAATARDALVEAVHELLLRRGDARSR